MRQYDVEPQESDSPLKTSNFCFCHFIIEGQGRLIEQGSGEVKGVREDHLPFTSTYHAKLLCKTFLDTYPKVSGIPRGQEGSRGTHDELLHFPPKNKIGAQAETRTRLPSAPTLTILPPGGHIVLSPVYLASHHMAKTDVLSHSQIPKYISNCLFRPRSVDGRESLPWFSIPAILR